MKQRISGISGVLSMPLYMLFRGGVWLKNRLYDWGMKKPVDFDARVISVGGISFGGAGKTPMVIYLAKTALEMADRIGKTAVVSRGYRRNTSGSIIVSDGKKVRASVYEAGDELYMIARRVDKIPVIADENRIRGAGTANERFGVKNIILDDAFQHRSISRKVDIVMLEPEVALGYSRYFLRENLASLKRADIIVSLDAGDYQREVIIKIISRHSGAELFFGIRKPKSFRALKDSSAKTVRHIQQLKTAAFCALANPGRFGDTLKKMGIHPVNILSFPDHCSYDLKDLDRIAHYFVTAGAEALITTEKDAVKLPPVLSGLPIYYLTIDLEIENSDRLRKLVFH